MRIAIGITGETLLETTCLALIPSVDIDETAAIKLAAVVQRSANAAFKEATARS